MAPAASLLCGYCDANASFGAAARHGRGQHGAPARHEAAPEQRVRGYLPPPAVGPTRGSIDFHTHAAPDVFGSAGDDDEPTGLAAAREMEAVVLAELEAAGVAREQIQTMRRETPGARLMG